MTAKIKISVMKANGTTTSVEVENGDPQVLAETLESMGIDAQRLTRNGGEYDEDEPLEEDDVVVESKSAKGA
jgi:hypothetical protein